MGIEDILTLPETFEVEGKEYKSEFDCKAYGILESMTNKSVFKIQDLIADNNLMLLDSIEVVCAGLLKHHTTKEIEELRQVLMDKPYIIKQINMPVIKSFFKGIAPPEVFKIVQELDKEIGKIENDKKKVTKTKV